jgi:PAS domain S-box-containing protein
LSNVPASIFWKDLNSVFLGANRRFASDTGIQDPQELVGKTDYDLAWTREQADFYRACDRKVMESGEPMLNIEESQLQANGEKIELLTNKVPLFDEAGQVTGMLGIYMDVTPLKDAEATLRKSEARLQTLFDSAAEFIFVINPEGVIIKANRYVYNRSGYKEDEVIGKNIKNFFTEESKTICDCNFPGLREHGYNRADIEFACKDGNVIQMECSATAVPDDEGNFTTFLIIQRDMTERKRPADALANSERRFRAIFNSTYQLIGVLDSDGILLQANQTALDLGALKEEDVIGLPFWETYWWSYSAEVRDRLKAAVSNAAQGKRVGYEEDVRGAGGVIRTIEFTLTPVIDQYGETALIIPEGRDITEKKRTEKAIQEHRQELAHVTRFSTMGEMASGIAHELNQPLAALTSYCGTATSLAKSVPAVSQELCDVLEHASEQAHRAGSIIRHLREFTIKETDHKQLLDIDLVMTGVNALLCTEFKNADVKFEHHLDGRGRKVMANKVQIEQVIVNLLMNSIEAIQSAQSNDGKVILETHVSDGEFIEVTVADNGPGINVDIMGKMFDPFQTSKASGMGMGLTISRSIIEEHGGRLWADEQRRHGALFGFRLPARD